jgi:hypothetical protein
MFKRTYLARLMIVGCVMSGLMLPGCSPASISPTATSIPETNTPISTSTPTLAPTPTLTLTPTITPLPTLAPDKAKEKIAQLWKENANCDLPCFWGIVPENTRIEEVQNLFKSLNIFLADMDDGTFDAGISSEGGLDGYVTFSVQDQVVQGVQIDLSSLQFNKVPAEDWSAFNPKKVLAQYGTPSNVEFFVSTPHDGNDSYKIFWYDMLLYYENIDMMIEYGFGIPHPQNSFHICPNLQGKNSFDYVTISLGKQVSDPSLSHGTPLETSSSITLEDFYRILTTKDDQNACFDLNKDVPIL